MNYYRLNQIDMAVLGALLLFFGTKTIVNKYTAFGPQQNVPATSVVGWETCHTDTYGISGTSLAICT